MKTAVPVVVALACLVCLHSDLVGAKPTQEPPAKSFFDKIFDIPRSVLKSVNHDLNEKGAKCKDGSVPIKVDGQGTCHDRALDIPKSALDSVNDFLNG